MNEYVNFSSLPPDQEATFVVYERHTQENLKKAFTIGAICSLIFGVLAVGLYFGVEPEEDKTAKDMDLNQLKKKSKTGTPEAPTPNK